MWAGWLLEEYQAKAKSSGANLKIPKHPVLVAELSGCGVGGDITWWGAFIIRSIVNQASGDGSSPSAYCFL
jgi:hypothetical protein